MSKAYISGFFAIGAKGKFFSVKESSAQNLLSAYMFLTPKELAERIHKDALEHDARDQQLCLNKKQVMKLFEGIAMVMLGLSKLLGGL